MLVTSFTPCTSVDRFLSFLIKSLCIKCFLHRNIPSKHSFIRQMEMNRATTFYVPGVDVKLHYNSATQMSGQPDVRFRELFTPPDSPQTSPSHGMPDIEVNTPGGTQAFKTKPGEARESRACVYTWLLIQSLPEMIISPYFLDFLEQTLTAIPDTPSTSARESVRTSNTSCCFFLHVFWIFSF